MPKFSLVEPSLKRLFGYLKPYKLKLAFAVVFLLGSASTSSLTATLLGKLTDIGFYQKEKWIVIAAPISLILVSLLFAICSVLSNYIMTDISQSILEKLRLSMFEKILKWPSKEYLDHTTGEISSKFVNEAAVALSGATQSLIVLIRDSVQVIALLCVLFWYNWQLTLVTFLIAPSLIIVLRKISKRVRKIVKENQETLGNMISRVQESYVGQKIVKLYGTYDFEEAQFSIISNKIRKLTIKNIKMSSISTPITQLLTMVAVAFVVGVALFEAQKGILTLGEFITFLSAMLLMKAPIQHLAGLNATFANISVAARSIFDVLDTEMEKDEGKLVTPRVKGEIKFDHVFLRYPGESDDALKDICFTVSAGQHIALVGESGSGKSSLVNLLPRYWDISSGNIYIDGIPISEYSLESLRNQISFVSQDIILFDDTIKNNLVYGCSNISDNAIREALKGASIDQFIDSLPDGLNSRVGESGNLLSGGQKQRLSIARAVLKNAPILILDEATSALDSENEHAIKEALDRLTKNRTTLTIAHRLSTIEDADTIIVLAHGEIAEIGTSRELLSKPNGIYKELHHLQKFSA